MIILSGGGAGPQTTELYEFYSRTIDHQRPILYIPVAIPTDDYSGCLSWIQNELGAYGLTKIDMIYDIEELEELDFKNYSSVFIGGGNTYRLLELFKTSTVFEKVRRYLKDDGIVLGGSAGAILFGRDIDTSAFEDGNESEFEDLSGYNLLCGYSILCHYDSEDSRLSTFINEYTGREDRLVALPEETSLIVNGEDVLVIGQKECKIYYKGREEMVRPGNPVVFR